MRTSKEIMSIFTDKIETVEIGNEEVCTLAEGLGYYDPNSPLVITNKKSYFGAMEIFNPNTIRKVIERMGGHFYILPSSVHELIVVPVKDTDKEALLNMVTEINKTEVAEDERLGDFVMEYDANTDWLTIANKRI